MSKTPYILNLPQDIIFNILSLIPTKSLLQFRCVCTSTPPLISHPSFIKLHLSYVAEHHILVYYESTDQFVSFLSPVTFRERLKLEVPFNNLHGYLRIVGSNKGVICLFDTNYYSNLGTVLLWNPSIQKFKTIDDPHNVVGDKFSRLAVGFGFVSRTCEFKVVEIVYRHLDGASKVNNNDVLVYSLSTTSWKKKEDMSAPCYLTTGWSSNVVVNGFVNWLALKEATRGDSHVIMAFDLDGESFRVLELPEDVSMRKYYQISIGSYGQGSLSLSLCVNYHEYCEEWEVWVMRDYGLVDSWKKLFVVSQQYPLTIPPLLMKNDDEVLIVKNDGRLMLFDAIKNEMQDLDIQGSPSSFRAISYAPSLALLDA